MKYEHRSFCRFLPWILPVFSAVPAKIVFAMAETQPWAGVRYKVAFWNAQWAFSIDQCISCLLFLSLYFEYDFHNK